MIETFQKIKNGFLNKQFWFKQRFVDNFSFIHIRKCGGTSIEHFLKIPKTHDTAAQRMERIGATRWEKNFTFSIVRNPYSRVVSYYKWFKKKYHGENQDQLMSLNEWIELSYKGTFEESYYKQKDHNLLKNPFNEPTCFDSVTQDGQIIVKKIIKLEELDIHWEQLCKELNIKFTPLHVENRTSMHTSENALELLTESNKQLINDYFERDFITFKYKH